MLQRARDTGHDSRAKPRYTRVMQKSLHPGIKLALDIGPLIVFFVGNARFGIFPASSASPTR
jgi:hypothetical protein